MDVSGPGAESRWRTEIERVERRSAGAETELVMPFGESGYCRLVHFMQCSRERSMQLAQRVSMLPRSDTGTWRNTLRYLLAHIDSDRYQGVDNMHIDMIPCFSYIEVSFATHASAPHVRPLGVRKRPTVQTRLPSITMRGEGRYTTSLLPRSPSLPTILHPHSLSRLSIQEEIQITHPTATTPICPIILRQLLQQAQERVLVRIRMRALAARTQSTGRLRGVRAQIHGHWTEVEGRRESALGEHFDWRD